MPAETRYHPKAGIDGGIHTLMQYLRVGVLCLIPVSRHGLMGHRLFLHTVKLEDEERNRFR